MREISIDRITTEVARLCQEANYFLPQDVLDALEQSLSLEQSPIGRQTLEQIIENAKLAGQEQMAICQDCGATVVYLEVGQDVHIIGGSLYEAINEGVRQRLRYRLLT